MKYFLTTVISFSALFVAVLVGLVGCKRPEVVPTSGPVDSSTVSKTDSGYISLTTMEHDKCWFVVVDTNYGASVVHHPKCPNCTEK